MLKSSKGIQMHNLSLPIRHSKPRNMGLNILIDNGYPLQYFTDVIESAFEQIDFVKFGWGTSIVSPQLKAKMNVLKRFNIDYFFGGTLFEKYLYQNKIDAYKKFLDEHDCQYVEISNGTIDVTNREKSRYITDFANNYHVFSEVGLKDCEKSEKMSPKKWIEYIEEDFAAGSFKVITESRESGTSGICRSNGELRIGLIEEIMESSIVLDNLVFEAPNKKLQMHFIKKLGTNCNLANIPFSDIIALETLRLGLRSDTFFLFENNPKGV